MPTTDEDALRAMRAASPALQKWWPDGESPVARSWEGVTWSDDRVQGLDLRNSNLEVLSPEIGQLQALTKLVLSECLLMELPPQIGQLRALTTLNFFKCPLKELPPEFGQLLALTNLVLIGCRQLTLAPGAEAGQPAQTIVAAYAPLLIVEPHKGTAGQLHAFLLNNPLTVPAFLKSIVTDAAHADWLGEAVNATPELAELTDADGRHAVDVAHATCRRKMQESSWLCKRYELQAGPPEHKSATSVVVRAEDHADKPDYAQIFIDADKDKSGTLEGTELNVAAEKLGLSKELVVSEASKQGSATSKDGTTQLDKDQFVSACKRLLGDGPRKVVIKLMEDKVPWQREMESRNLEWSAVAERYVPSQSKVPLDAQYVVQTLDAPSQAEMAAAVSKVPRLEKLGTHTIIMDAADRNLHQIYLQERPDTNAVRPILKQVFEAVAHLHEKKIMHGDLKMLNVVRFRLDNRLRLIDLDAAARILSEYDETGPSYAGTKFSSATLPPEMFFELTTEAQHSQLAAYWQGADEELRAKVAPKLHTRSGNAYVVKSFIAKDGKCVTGRGLPYELIDASETIDVWALGALAFSLLTGETLVPATRDDNCASGADMRAVYDWNPKARGVHERLKQISDDAAHDLVGKMLQRDPLERPTVKKLLEHPFFHPKSGDAEMAKKMEEQLVEICKLREEQRENFEKQANMLSQIDLKIDQVLDQLSVQFNMLSTLMLGVDKLAPKLICFLPADAFGDTPSTSWASKAKLFKPSNLFNQEVRVFFFDPIHLSLAPTNVTEKYPNGEGFLLKYPKAWVAKAMPYVKLGLTILKVAYVAGRLAGFPVPDVAGVVGSWIDGQLGELSSLAAEATAWLGEQTKDPTLARSLLAQVDENARKAIAGDIDAIKPLEGDTIGDNMRAPLEKSFEELDTLLKPDYGDWRTKSGLVLTTSQKDGTSEYVLEADTAAYEEHGASLFSSEPPPLPAPAQTAEASTTRDGVVDELERLKAENGEQKLLIDAQKLANSELKVKNEQLLVDA